MNPESENFDALRKLLAIKRHETPPPGYFEQLASEVRARLRGGEHRRSDLWNEVGEEASWLQRAWGLLYTKPAFAGAFGVLVCGVLLAGMFYSQEQEEATAASTGLAEKLALPASPRSALALSPTANEPANSSSTNPVLNVQAGRVQGNTLFDKIGMGGNTAPVNFNPGN
jgi:hypothetical protein